MRESDLRGGSLPISAVVTTKNEERNLRTCIASLSAFSEVLIFDSNSSDATAAVAAELGVPVIPFTWNGEYPKKKQWFLDNVTTRNEWVLFVDGDERMTPALARELFSLISENEGLAAVDVPIEYYWRGHRLDHGHRVVKRALLRRGNVAFPVVDDLDIVGMGELEGHYQPSVAGETRTASTRLRHDDRDGLTAWFARHNRYSDWEAAIRVRLHARTTVGRHKTSQGARFDRTPCKPLVFFLYSFVLKRGFLDGRAGFEYALSLAFYYFQIECKRRELAEAR